MAGDETNFAIEDAACLGSFSGADVDAIVVDGYLRLCRMRTQSVTSGDDALRYRIWQLTFVLREVVGEVIVDRLCVVFLSLSLSLFSFLYFFGYYFLNLFLKLNAIIVFFLFV